MRSSRVQEGMPEQIDFDVFGMIVLVIGALTAKLSQQVEATGPGRAGPARAQCVYSAALSVQNWLLGFHQVEPPFR